MKVGIEENVGFKAEVNDKGTLVINAFRVAPQVEDEDIVINLDSTALDEEYNVSSDSSNIMLFPLQLKGFEGGELKEVRSFKPVLQDITNFRNQLTHILEQYTDRNSIVWDTYANSDYTHENVKPSVVTTEEFLATVYRNLSAQFVNQLKEFGDPNKPLRVLFVRTSKKSHYPTLRKQKLDEFPFAESMDVPVEKSKLKYQKWELDGGFNDPTPIADTQSQEDKDTSALGDAGL